eukprot:3803709-Rhodomonas_salina.1
MQHTVCDYRTRRRGLYHTGTDIVDMGQGGRRNQWRGREEGSQKKVRGRRWRGGKGRDGLDEVTCTAGMGGGRVRGFRVKGFGLAFRVEGLGGTGGGGEVSHGLDEVTRR